jgi:hypothetical protein
MGQAKLRGTFEERKNQSIAKKKEELRLKYQSLKIRELQTNILMQAMHPSKELVDASRKEIE